uniref:Cytochrome P450 CYP71AT91 n=1 Tax=Salvia miltiorrhiza TaxID=226208 RepID=A0A0B4VSN4_SALMI|nr:cytochrome P450 CYP71AT91 [Salvia miltiorrhiza]
MMILVILLLILAASLLFLFHRRKTVQKSPPPPGPRGLPFIGSILQLDPAAPHIYLWKLSLKYGPLMSMKLGSVPVIVVSSSDIAKQVLKTHDLVFSSRPKLLGQHKLFYKGLDVAFAPYSDSWRETRKICVVHLLSIKRVQSFRPTREEEVSRMVTNLSAGSGRVANLTAVMLDLTSTLICRVAFGKERDEGESRMRSRFDELMIESQAVQAGFAFVSDYLPWFGWVDRLNGMIAKLDRVFKDLDDFLEELIQQHLDPNRPKSKNPNILELLIQLKNENSSSLALTWDHVKAILMDIFVAGTDTGAATVIWAMTALIKNPETMKRLQKEMSELVGERRQVDEDDLAKLPYLSAVVKEALRLFPPAPLLLPRESIQSCNINGYAIPAKTLVFVNAWAIARDPNSWENPDEFVPERFLNSGIDVIGTDFEVIPFGAGRRGCPGIAMGLATVELALANLVHSFHWELPPGITKEDIDTQVSPGLTMHKKNPLCLMPISRYTVDHKNSHH